MQFNCMRQSSRVTCGPQGVNCPGFCGSSVVCEVRAGKVRASKVPTK